MRREAGERKGSTRKDSERELDSVAVVVRNWSRIARATERDSANLYRALAVVEKCFLVEASGTTGIGKVKGQTIAAAPSAGRTSGCTSGCWSMWNSCWDTAEAEGTES